MKIGIISDDLTGANASGVALTKQGFHALTLIHSSSIPAESYDTVIMDTDSRYLSEKGAYSRVFHALSELKEWGSTYIAKRIDSTLRGNVGAEIDAMLEADSRSVAIVAPSFPSSGRVVSGGYMLVNGVPLEQTDVAKDPVKPISQSYIPDFLQNHSKYKVDNIFLRDILLSPIQLKEKMEEKISKGCRILCCDAVSNEHLQTIGEAMRKIAAAPVIPVDPGPLTAYYTNALLESRQQEKRAVLVMIGSATSLTSRQLEYLKEKMSVEIISVDVEKLASYTSSWQKEVEEVTDQAVNKIKLNEVTVITTQGPGFGQINLSKRAATEGYSEKALAKRITDGLGSIFRKTMEKVGNVNVGCFSSGGDVTASICAFSRARGIELKEEVMPLAAYGKLSGGYFDGLSIVTKGGMVGDDKAILQSVQFLQSKLIIKRSGC